MRVLILGGDGMLGHQIYKTLREHHQTAVTLRQAFAAYAGYGLFDPATSFCEIDARSLEQIATPFEKFKPQVVVNCIGLVKQRDKTTDALSNLELNALLPHRLAQLTSRAGASLIHISTDCVFSGRTGMYVETDPADAEDLYGRTKLLGEVTSPGCLTLRTSIVGRELARKQGLLEWYLAQTGTVQGYRRAIFSGVTTVYLSRVIRRLIERYPGAHGLYHVSGEAIDKCALLHLLRDRFRSGANIVGDDAVVINRSLDSSRFCREFDCQPPTWSEMVAEL
jgi:dTDP-4-dehydrorhamnose reductase